MKSIFIFIFMLSSVGVVEAQERIRTADRLAAIVAYVVADYPGAVKDGRVLAEDEYKEQGGLLAEGRDIAAALDAPAAPRARLVDAFTALERAFAAKVPEPELAEKGRVVHRLLIDELGLVLAPVSPPSPARAEKLYTDACARCHGADGRANTEEGNKLAPKPVSFFDEERMRRISPELAFHALTFGVTGTGMASFDTLPIADRWSLAFHVVGLRYAAATKAERARGAEVLRTQVPALPQSASKLSAMTDDEIGAAIGAVAPADRASVLAFLRAEAPFRAEPGGRFAIARTRLHELAAAADDHARARELAIAAYLEGIEPHEAALKAKDRALSDRLEKTFLGLRQSIEGGLSGDALRKEVARAALVVDAVEEKAQGGASVPFLAAFAIALREGFELSLLLAALLAFLRRAGRASDARYVHLGWIAAIPTGVVTWFAIGAALSGARRELTEGILTLVAASMLLFVSHFVLGRLESRKWLKFLERSTVEAGARPESRVGFALFSVAFVAAFREAIEIVLFFKALLLDAGTGAWAVIGGAAAGLAVLVALVLGLSRVGRRLNPRPLMLASSIVLTALAISLVGQGIRALQEGGIVPLSPLALPSISTLGLYATTQGLLTQLAVLLLVLVPTFLEKRRAPPASAPR